MHQKELDPIVKNLAKKYNRSISEIEDIVKSPYYLVAEVMEKGDRINGVFFNVRIRGLGIFKMCSRTVLRMRKREESLKNKEEECNT